MSRKMVLYKELDKQIKLLMQQYEELLAIVICDVEGACILKVINNNRNDMSINDNFHCQKLITCAENLPKLKLGECRRLLCSFDRHKVMVFNHEKIILAAFATNNMLTGCLRTIELQLTPVCDLINRHIKDLQ